MSFTYQTNLTRESEIWKNFKSHYLSLSGDQTLNFHFIKEFLIWSEMPQTQNIFREFACQTNSYYLKNNVNYGGNYKAPIFVIPNVLSTKKVEFFQTFSIFFYIPWQPFKEIYWGHFSALQLIPKYWYATEVRTYRKHYRKVISIMLCTLHATLHVLS